MNNTTATFNKQIEVWEYHDKAKSKQYFGFGNFDLNSTTCFNSKEEMVEYMVSQTKL